MQTRHTPCPHRSSTSEIQNGSITEAQLDAAAQAKLNTAGSGNVADGTITTAKLHDDAVTDAKITDGAITETKLAMAVQTKLNQAAPTWSTISGKPTVVAAGVDQATARSAIGAGTSNLTLGTSSSTAKAGDYQPSWTEVTGKPAVIGAGADQAAARAAIGAGTSNLALGITGSTAAAGNDGRLSDTRTPTDNTVSTAKLQDNAVTNTKIADGTIAEAKLATSVQTKLNASAPTWSTISGKPAVVAAGTNQSSARDAISAVARGDLAVNVKDYGALGQNTDDTAAITAALDALTAITGADNAAGILYFPPGKYLDTAQRAIPSNRRIHVMGAGQDTTILTRPSGATNGDWWTFGARHSGISRLTLEGGRYQGVTGDNVVLNASYTYVEHVWTGKAGGNGITVGKAAAAIVHRLNQVMVRENAGRGIETVTGSGSTDGMWSNIEIGNSGSYGVYLGTGAQNLSNIHVWGSGLEHATEFDGAFLAGGNNELINFQTEKNLGRGVRIESGGNTVRGRAWGNVFGAVYVNSGIYNDIDLMAYRNSVGNPSATASDSYVQCIMTGTSVRNRVRMKVWDDTADMSAGSYVTAPTYPYPGRSGAIRTHTRALVELSANCNNNVYDFDAPRDVTRLSSGTAPYTNQGVDNRFSPSCYWGPGVPIPTRSVVSGAVRIPPESDSIIVAVEQEITAVLGNYASRIVRILWTAANPQPIRTGATLQLASDFSPVTGSTMTLLGDGTDWYELSRSE